LALRLPLQAQLLRCFGLKATPRVADRREKLMPGSEKIPPE
jgi:hypothetical protein